MLPVERRARLLEALRERGAIHIAALSRQLGVSAMTLHRDIDELVRQGYARKVRGGAVASAHWRPVSTDGSAPAASPSTADRCGICGKPAGGRHVFVVHRDAGPPALACCAHCGLLMLEGRARTAMASDFLFGHSISARTAYYVAGPDLVVCCAPAVLPFGRRRDAERFCQGFGGRVLALEQALDWVRAEMALNHTRH